MREIIDRIDGKAPAMVTNDAEEFQKAIDMTDEQLDAAIARAERLLGEAQREEAKKSRIATSITQRRVTL